MVAQVIIKQSRTAVSAVAMCVAEVAAVAFGPEVLVAVEVGRMLVVPVIATRAANLSYILSIGFTRLDHFNQITGNHKEKKSYSCRVCVREIMPVRQVEETRESSARQWLAEAASLGRTASRDTWRRSTYEARRTPVTLAERG